MKKLLLMLVMAASAVTMQAQKFALVDMEYILKNIPAYERAEVVFLSKEQKQTRQDAIVEKEKQAADLKKKYFGPEGELFKKRSALMSPIQDEIYNAIKDIADLRGYQLVLDRASDTGIIFGSPRIDISSEVLRKLGYAY